MTESKELLNEFGYIIDKIQSADFSHDPFDFILIDNFLSKEHFDEFTSAKEIKRPVPLNTENLIDDLMDNGYKIQRFPGCSTSVEEYLKALNSKNANVDKELLEGFGMAFRLTDFQTPILQRLTEFLNSNQFKVALEKKFNITESNYVDTGIQKYLQGYEISPHPDIRKKAATYMLNINTDKESENIAIHTYLCKFKPEREYIYDFWENHEEMDRCWVPWEWCDISLKTNANNSIILFSPSNTSLHAVKLDYDHLKFQRTQVYGNLWYDETTIKYSPSYKEIATKNIDIEAIKKKSKESSMRKIIARIPGSVKRIFKD
ncbi:MAG: hypothetical protein R2797_04010 [Gelidibacter sp.]